MLSCYSRDLKLKLQLNVKELSKTFENNYHINKLEKGLIENSELFRIDNLIEQSQNKNS